MSLRGLLRRVKVGINRARDRESFDRHNLVGRPEVWRSMREFQFNFLRGRGLQPHHTFVDIGCGTLRGGIPVIELLEPNHYVGLDSNLEALAEAEKEIDRYGLRDRSPELLYCEDFATLRCDRTFDFAWAHAVLIHLPDDVLEKAIGWTSDRLNRDGVFYADVLLGPLSESSGGQRGWPVLTRPFGFYSDVAARHGLACEDLGPRTELGAGGQTTPQTRHMLYMRKMEA